MNERILRPAHIAAAAAVLGGGLIIAMPQYGMSVARVVIASIAAAAAIWTLILASPPAWWRSPFESANRPARRNASKDELDRIRSSMDRRRHRIADGPPLPAATVRLLQPLIVAALEREGIDASRAGAIEPPGGRLSTVTLAVLRCPQPQPLPWYRTLRPDVRATAAIVHHVLDDLERLALAGTVGPKNDVLPAHRPGTQRAAASSDIVTRDSRSP